MKSPAVAGLALAFALFAPRKLYAQPITYSGYVEPHQEGWSRENGNGRGKLLDQLGCEEFKQDEWVCGFSKVLAGRRGKPSPLQYLAMFSEKYVENNGKFYAVKNSQGNGAMTFTEDMTNGLYEIIAAPTKYEPIQVIGVDQVTNRIYGYYPTNSGEWARKRTLWGDAKGGSMSSTDNEVIGLTTNDRMFNLYGDFSNFNYGKQDDVECAGSPSNIDEWSGRLAGYRGRYCPGVGDNQLLKSTWHRSGTRVDTLNYAPASKITRFESNIWGITTDEKLLILWNDDGTIRSAPINLPFINGVRAVGGLEDKYVWDSGVLLTNGDDSIYNVYWRDGSWKEKKITIEKPKPAYAAKSALFRMSVLFGSHNGEIYMLYGWYDYINDLGCDNCSLTEVHLYHMEFVGGTDRYKANLIQGDTFV